jgi:hypothetical protein
MASWRLDRIEVFWLVSNLAMVASEWRYTTVIHLRKVSAGDVLRRITEMTIMQTVLSYLLLKVVDLQLPVGKSLLRTLLPLMSKMLTVSPSAPSTMIRPSVA